MKFDSKKFHLPDVESIWCMWLSDSLTQSLRFHHFKINSELEHQQYIKSLPDSSKKLVLKKFSSWKIKFPGISPKSAQKEAFR